MSREKERGRSRGRDSKGVRERERERDGGKVEMIRLYLNTLITSGSKSARVQSR